MLSTPTFSAALALRFPAAPAAFGATQDVDTILPLGWLEAEEQNLDFREAQQKTNEGGKGQAAPGKSSTRQTGTPRSTRGVEGGNIS